MLTFDGLPTPASSTLTLSGKRDATQITAVFDRHIEFADLQKDILVKWHGNDWHTFGATKAAYKTAQGRTETTVNFTVGPWRLNAAMRARNNRLLREELERQLPTLLANLAAPLIEPDNVDPDDVKYKNQTDYWQQLIGNSAELYEAIYHSVLMRNLKWDDCVRILFEQFWLLVQVNLNFTLGAEPVLTLVNCLDPINTADTTAIPNDTDFSRVRRADIRYNELVKMYWSDSNTSYEFTPDDVDLTDVPGAATYRGHYHGHWPSRPTGFTDAQYRQLIFDRAQWSGHAHYDRDHAVFDAELRQLELYRENRLAEVTLPAYRITDLNAYRPGNKVRVRDRNFYIVEATLSVPDYTLQLDLCEPLRVQGKPLPVV